MSRQGIIDPQRIELTLLQQSIAKSLSASDVRVIEPEIRVIQLLDQMVYELKAYVLADHVDTQRAQYETIELPKWLRWLKRFCKVTQYEIGIDAYFTYPNANVPLPDLGQSRKTVTFYRTQL